jgi:hypothetical protein
MLAFGGQQDLRGLADSDCDAHGDTDLHTDRHAHCNTDGHTHGNANRCFNSRQW